ncbi:hypothetical protein B0T25DRAFT_562677 [Lasiosphaeria hispida]|uniref:Uncharacterized protein n=1 Tax=Lasiosphaeria hispida TaxID=260671 RepID=A0AAJ0MKD5_9PEZI|nr:hypothetical protein B0T25DRAFT_562677 [Lasiosphaeria hispida]
MRPPARAHAVLRTRIIQADSQASLQVFFREPPPMRELELGQEKSLPAAGTFTDVPDPRAAPARAHLDPQKAGGAFALSSPATPPTRLLDREDPERILPIGSVGELLAQAPTCVAATLTSSDGRVPPHEVAFDRLLCFLERGFFPASPVEWIDVATLDGVVRLRSTTRAGR